MPPEVAVPARAASDRRAPERPTKNATDDAAGDGTERTSDHKTRACAGSRSTSLTKPGPAESQTMLMSLFTA